MAEKPGGRTPPADAQVADEAIGEETTAPEDGIDDVASNDVTDVQEHATGEEQAAINRADDPPA